MSTYYHLKCNVCGIGPDDSWIVNGLDWAWAFVIFAEIPGGEGYRVGSDGSVWSCRTTHPGVFGQWKQLRPDVFKSGHLRVTLTIDGKPLKVFVHDLVLTAFVGPRPEGMVARHFPDRTPSNNNSWNLRWGTTQENSDDRIVHGTTIRGSQVVHAKLVEADIEEILEAIARGEHLRDVAARYCVHESRLSHILAGRAWNHVGGDRLKTNHYVRKLKDEDIADALRLWKSGMQMKDIANRLGVDPSTISRTINRRKNSDVEV